MDVVIFDKRLSDKVINVNRILERTMTVKIVLGSSVINVVSTKRLNCHRIKSYTNPFV